MIDDIDCLIVNGDSYSASQQGFAVYGEVLSRRLGVPFYNFSVAGCSNDRILRSTIQYFPRCRSQYRNPLVIVGWSFLHRIEVYYHGSDAKIIARAPDQFNTDSPLRLMTLDWIPDSELLHNSKKILTAVTTIEKKIIDWYLGMYLLSNFFDTQHIRYYFFSAADNTDFDIDNFSALKQFDFVQCVKSNPKIFGLHTFCVQHWAKNNDPECNPVTGHLSSRGHDQFADFMIGQIL